VSALSVDALATFVEGIRIGTIAATRGNVRALLEAGTSREAMLDALVAGAEDPAASRGFHRALAVLRDLDAKDDGSAG
jgi:hypothetical protein